ncbi:Triosephosphate isomerase [Pisolithus marmoratus]|nr:Triosephosphate isomerase [Pisolithus marmoratus]
MPHQFFVSGNFKMNLISQAQKEIIINELNGADLDPNTEVVIAPPLLYLLPLKEIVKNGIQVSAQNCYCKISGVYTGKISPAQLADAGIPYVIIGKTYLPNCTMSLIPFLQGKKVKQWWGNDNLYTYMALFHLHLFQVGSSCTSVGSQLHVVVTVLNESDWGCVVIAYEPVWAIGTGKVTTAAQAQEVHAYIHQYLLTAVSPVVSENTRIIYGGSVMASNFYMDTATQIDVDRFLIGGALLKPEFVDIINMKRN